MDQPDNFELDVRIRDRLLKVGRIDRQGVEQHLSKLPDVSDRADLVTIAQPALAPERAAAEPPIALALASEAAVRHIEAPPRPAVVEAPEEEVEDEDEDEDEDEELSAPVGQPAPAAPAKPDAAAVGDSARQAPAIQPITVAAEQPPSFVAVPEPTPPEPPAPEPLPQTLSEATLRAPLAAPPPPPPEEPAAVEPVAEPLEAAPETPATSPLRSEPVASTEPAPVAEQAAAGAPPEEAPAPSSAKPVSVPASSSAASDGTTEVPDEGWDVPEEPGGNA